MNTQQPSIADSLAAVLSADNRQGGKTMETADHLVSLPTEWWAMWRWIGLRGAGFPAKHVLQLADSACADVANQLLACEAQVQHTLNAALDEIRGALDRLRTAESWDDEERRNRLLDALRTLKKGRVPQLQALVGVDTTAIEAYRSACVQREALAKEFEQVYIAATSRVSHAIYELAANPAFREALVWQNRRAFHTGIAMLQPPGSGPRSSKQRQHEELVASYVQRYCVKNDTIGFFGPVGWARFTSDGAPIIVQPGPTFLKHRQVDYEQWAIDTLADTLGKDKWMRPWIAPRRLPFVHISGNVLYRPSKSPARIAPAQAAVLQACTGDETAQSIARRVRQMYPLEVKSEAEVYKLLEQFCALGLIVWMLEVPFSSHPEQGLRSRLELIGEEGLRQSKLAVLDEMEARRADVHAAAGDPDRLDQALATLEATFTRLTGEDATRNAGATYAARTLVYEDTQRDVEVTIGPELLAELDAPMSLLLTSARWFTHEAAALYRTVFDEIFADLVPTGTAQTVELTAVWQQMQLRVLGDHAPHVPALVRIFQERWADVLMLPDDQRRVNYTSAELAARVAAAFAAPGPGWQNARHHSPDLMIAAASAEAIRNGDYLFVMGEMHLASNTLRGAFFIEQHPAAEELYEAVARDMPKPRMIPVIPRTWPELTSRTRPDFITGQDFRITYSNDAVVSSQTGVIPIGALIVERGPNGLEVRSRDGQFRLDVIEFAADILALRVIDGFKLIAPRLHTPRITIDRLVVCRESWRVPAAALTFATEKTETQRFLAARRWQQSQGLPRCVFIKTPIERKPFFLDFDSPILVNMFAKAIRRMLEHGSASALISISEMLPALDETWLTDSAGNRYTSELRIIAVDQINTVEQA